MHNDLQRVMCRLMT